MKAREFLKRARCVEDILAMPRMLKPKIKFQGQPKNLIRVPKKKSPEGTLESERQKWERRENNKKKVPKQGKKSKKGGPVHELGK